MSIETGILTTKLFVPPLRLDLVPRPRLMEPLDAAPGSRVSTVPWLGYPWMNVTTIRPGSGPI
jgi:hypothetical protein